MGGVWRACQKLSSYLISSYAVWRIPSMAQQPDAAELLSIGPSTPAEIDANLPRFLFLTEAQHPAL